jgi:hypothetical protein
VQTAASVWSRFPTIYEINTWVWLTELRQKYGKPSLDLSTIPAAEWDVIASYGFDAVWLMGVWERSPAGIAIANQNQGLLQDFHRALPDFRPDDNVGSPYCIRRYVADEHLGGPQGLAMARRELSNRGMKLILDFVPNHVAPDHPWAIDHPEYFIRGNVDDLKNDPSSFVEIRGTVFACGRDPFFPAWPDVLQLNPFEPRLRLNVIATVSDIARQCDGIRCDMAMLLLNSVVERTWGNRAGPPPATEYWTDVISATKHQHPGFLFMAEAYWDLEWELQQKGFDFCYDKKLYDRLEHNNAEDIRLHLCAARDYQDKLVRFIENHDEPRAAAAFPSEKELAAALITSSLPGAKLFHEGQLEGRRVRLPVFLGRRPNEPLNHDLQEFYAKLLHTVTQPVFLNGQWTLCSRTGWPDNMSCQNLLAWTWVQGDERYLILVNFAGSGSQGRVQVVWDGIDKSSWRLLDVLSGAIYERDGKEMQAGLYVELEPWKFNLFRCTEPSLK